jgi:hypothetical protein
MLTATAQFERLRYTVRLPGTVDAPPADPQPLRPVLCFLHGSGEHDGALSLAEALARHGPLKDDARTRTASAGFVVIVPQLPAPGGNVWHRYAADLEGLVRAVQRDHAGDPTRTYLTGFSYGGNGVLRLAGMQPRLWAALWPVDPTLRPIPRPAQPTWLSLGERSRGDERGLDRRGYRHQRVATDDTTAIYLDYGKDHPGTATYAYRDARIYAWLRTSASWG